jgi:membrane-bound lytic murein transglycosylase A
VGSWLSAQQRCFVALILVLGSATVACAGPGALAREQTSRNTSAPAPKPSGVSQTIAPSPTPKPSGVSQSIDPSPTPKPFLPVDPATLNPRLLIDYQLWGQEGFKRDQAALLSAISHSLTFLDTPKAETAYAELGDARISRDRVSRSLKRFRDLVRWSRNPDALAASLRREFTFYQPISTDGKGTAKFTGYFEPIYRASRTRTQEYRYPIYKLPPDLAKWPKPQPTRLELEGDDGLQADKGPIKGLELAWFKDRLEAVLVQVQGSARLRLTDGTTMSVGYAGKTDYTYVSLGRSLIDDGKVPAENLTLPVVLEYFRQNPDQLSTYVPRNPRFVFFRETQGAPALGSLTVPVTAERSIATDKSLNPPGALALIYTQLPVPKTGGGYEYRWVSRYVLDQDTGGAIRGPGRVDVFMGTGPVAGERAGLVNSGGQIFYLMLKDGF